MFILLTQHCPMKQYILVCCLILGAFSSGRLCAQESGTASFYDNYFNGKKMAGGGLFDNTKMTCAHKTLPFGTMLKVTKLANDKSVTVKVTDRGPYVKGRVLDLTKAAAKELGFVNNGTAHVMYEIIRDDKAEPVDSIQFQNSQFITISPPDTVLFQDYGIKIAAYENADIALKTANDLVVKYKLPVSLERFALARGNMYRLFLDKFTSENEAEAMIDKVKKAYPGCYVIQYSKFK